MTPQKIHEKQQMNAKINRIKRKFINNREKMRRMTRTREINKGNGNCSRILGAWIKDLNISLNKLNHRLGCIRKDPVNWKDY